VCGRVCVMSTVRITSERWRRDFHGNRRDVTWRENRVTWVDRCETTETSTYHCRHSRLHFRPLPVSIAVSVAASVPVSVWCRRRRVLPASQRCHSVFTTATFIIVVVVVVVVIVRHNAISVCHTVCHTRIFTAITTTATTIISDDVIGQRRGKEAQSDAASAAGECNARAWYYAYAKTEYVRTRIHIHS